MNDLQGAPPLDSPRLIDTAAAAGHRISPRMVETFRAQGLLPRPVRGPNQGRTPTWIYPDGADKQLLCLLGWRARTKDPGTLKVLLWIDGFPIPIHDVRSALVEGLEAMLAVIETTLATHVERQGLDPADRSAREAALTHFSGVFAAKRGPNALPRRSRVAASDRTRAIELVLKLFALGEHVDAAPGEADTVERVLGVAPYGRHDTVFGAGPWLTGPAEALFDAAEIVALPKGLDAVRASTDDELEFARSIAAALLRYLPLMARLIGAVFDDENHAGFAGLSEFDRQPEFAMLLVPMVVSMLRAGWQENLQSVAAALEPMPHIADQAHRILGMPASTVRNNLSTQPTEVQQMANRLLDAALDGRLDSELEHD